MNDGILFFNSSISGAALLLGAMGLWFAAVILGLDRWSRHFFMSYFFVFMLCCLSGILEIVFHSYIVNSSCASH